MVPSLPHRPPPSSHHLPHRPKPPPPRRAFSVTDKEPEPVLAAGPPSRLSLLDLPPELHYALFDFLDPIDGVCLGLAHPRLYALHRRKHGTVPLSSRYAGPNRMEWAWHRAATSRSSSSPSPVTHRGLGYCRKCGTARCELHRHLRDWIGDGFQYCEIRRKFGPPAAREARPYCFLSSPKNPRRCGRHGGPRTTKVAT